MQTEIQHERLTPDQKDILMVHLIRSKEVFDKVVNVLQPEDFLDVEAAYRCIWEAAVRHWKEYGQLITKSYLFSYMEEAMKSSSMFPIEEEKALILELLDVIFDWEEDEIIPKMGTQLAQDFLDERRVQRELEWKGPVDAMLSRAGKAYHASRIGNGTDAATHATESEVLRHIFDQVAAGKQDEVFAELERAGITPESFVYGPATTTQQVHNAIFNAMEQLHANGEEVTRANVLGTVAAGVREEADDAMNEVDGAQPIQLETLKTHAAKLAEGQEEREVRDAMTKAEAGLLEGRTTGDVKTELTETLDLLPQRGRCVPSQADRMDDYTRSLAEEGTIIPVTCFRMRQAPITNDPEHPLHRRSSERSCFSDMLNGGLIPGEITAIGGRSGVGKSSFGLQIADGIAADILHSSFSR